MADEKVVITEERPKRDMSFLMKELKLPTNGNGSESSDQNKPDNAKNTETNTSKDNSAPPADPKDSTIETTDTKDTKTDPDKAPEGKTDEKKYELGHTFVAKAEVVKQLNEKFKSKYDFSKLDEESFDIYYQVLKEAKDGENKKEWTKSMGERENQIAEEKKKLNQELEDFNMREKELKAEKIRLKKLVDEEIDFDMTDDEILEKKVDKRMAKKELQDLATKEAKMKDENARLEAQQSKLMFYEDHNSLSKKFPELATSIHIKDVFARHAKKQEVDAHDVRVAFAVLKIVNDAIDYGMNPVEFYEYYKDNYKLPERKSSAPAGKSPANKSAEDKAAEELIRKAEELKKKQEEATPGIPPGGKLIDPNPPQRGHVIPGKTEKQKLNFIISGGKTG